MELFTFAVGVLLLMVVWRILIRKTVLDHHRDAFFDLRDELRATFIEKGWDVNSALYGQLRSITNGYLRYTENFSLLQFVYLEGQIKKSPTLQTKLKSDFEKNFVLASNEQMEYVTKFRKRSLDIMISYMILSSGPLAILSAIFVPIVTFCLIAKVIQTGFARGLRVIFRGLISANDSMQVIFNTSVGQVARYFIKRDFVEEFSFARVDITIKSSSRFSRA